jgi:hypothetical protein
MRLAPVPVLVFALRRPEWQAGVAAGAAWLAGGLNLWGYLRVLQAPAAVMVRGLWHGSAVVCRAGQTWGVAICKDMDFTNPAHSYGRAGVGLMLVSAWDFNVDRFWHGHIAVIRAVEDGFSLVQSARVVFSPWQTIGDGFWRKRGAAERPLPRC